MADAKQFQFDVWLTHANTVYRGVPYEVVTDWIQQGRLLEDDKIRPVGAEEWFVLNRVPAFAGYIPHPEPLRTDQQHEALEPVESGFAWGEKQDEETDPDMIPLIDVSLVLLIFFMMTSTIASAVGDKIKVPEAVAGVDRIDQPRYVWIGINFLGDDQPPSYTLRVETEKGRQDKTENLNVEQVLKKIDEILEQQRDLPEICIAAHKQLSFDLLRHLAGELEKYKAAGKVKFIRVEVGQKQ